jgi:hypothetical protein
LRHDKDERGERAERAELLIDRFFASRKITSVSARLEGG